MSTAHRHHQAGQEAEERALKNALSNLKPLIEVNKQLVKENERLRGIIDSAAFNLKVSNSALAVDLAGMRNDLGFYTPDFQAGMKHGMRKMQNRLEKCNTVLDSLSTSRPEGTNNPVPNTTEKE